MHPQLTLSFDTTDAKTFQSFHAGQNSLLLDRLRQFSEGESEDQQLLIWGPEGSGKSHLLNACCHQAARAGFRIAYVPAEYIYSPAVFDGLENCSLVCIDDLDRIPHDRELEIALFSLINACRDRDHRLLFASGGSPSELGTQLADLRTRLAWGATFAVHGLEADEVRAALQQRAEQSGLTIEDNVLDYLLNNFPRDISTQAAQLQRLDNASLQSHRRITIPLVRQVLLSTV